MRSNATADTPVQIRVGSELGRGGRPLYRQRSPHGLHRRRADDPSRGPHGADGQARLDPHHRRDLSLAEGYVEVKPLGAVQSRAWQTRSRCIEVSGAGTGRSRLQAAAARGLTRFVGRDPETGAAPLSPGAQPAPGHGQVVAVVGEPGVGKSRLFWEFTHSHAPTVG